MQSVYILSYTYVITVEMHSVVVFGHGNQSFYNQPAYHIACRWVSIDLMYIYTQWRESPSIKLNAILYTYKKSLWQASQLADV